MGHVVRVPSTTQRTRNGRPLVRYRANWLDPDGSQRARTFPSERAALDHLAIMEAAVLTGRYIDPAGAKITVAEYASHFLSTRQLRPTTAELYRTHLAVNVLPYLGSMRLGAVRRSDISGWAGRLASGDRLPTVDRAGRRVEHPKALAPSTVRLVHNIARMIFREAVRDRLITDTPFDRIPLPDAAPRQVRFLTPEQVWALADAIDPRYRALVLVGAGTGLRPGELFGLKVERINMLRRRLDVVEQLQWVPGGQPFHCPPKTRAGRRTVPLPAFVTEALAAHLAAYPSDSAVFTMPNGGLIQRNRWAERFWRPAHKAVGLPSSVTLHSLRHTYAAGLIAQGLHAKVIQERLGHASITETMDTYGHLFPSSEEETTAALDRVFGAARPVAASRAH